MKKLLDYIRADTTIKLKVLEELSELPRNTLQNALSDKVERDFPPQHAANLLETLINLRGGLIKIGDWHIELFDDFQNFLFWKISEEFEPVETESEGGISIFYPCNLVRFVVDGYELPEWLD